MQPCGCILPANTYSATYLSGFFVKGHTRNSRSEVSKAPAAPAPLLLLALPSIGAAANARGPDSDEAASHDCLMAHIARTHCLSVSIVAMVAEGTVSQIRCATEGHLGHEDGKKGKLIS